MAQATRFDGSLVHGPLPVPAPVPALGMRQRIASDPAVRRPVILTPHILAPCHLTGVEAQVDAADVVMLADLGATQAREVALGLVGAGAVIREGDAVVDAVRGEAGVQRVPVRRLIGVDRRARCDAAGDDLDRLILGADHEG